MSETGLERALDLLLRIASGEPGETVLPSGRPENEMADAFIIGLNMLNEELQNEQVLRTQAEALLQDERDAYSHSPALMCSVDAETLRVLKCNATLATALGQPLESLVGRLVTALFVDEDQELATTAFRAAANGEISPAPELRLAGKSGTLLVSASMSRTSTPSPRVRVVWRDVTRERVLEHQLREGQNLQAVGRLAGGVAHDFNNILSVVFTTVSLARRALGPESAVSDDLDVIEEAVQRGAGLTRQLLTFSRQHVAAPQPVSVCQAVEQLDRMLRRLVPKSIDLVLRLPEDDLIILIDPTQLEQVVANLIINARDAISDTGRIALEVEALVVSRFDSAVHVGVEPGPYVLLTVADDGRGMTADQLEQIFQPFFTTKPFEVGGGLGLSVCHGIVSQAGGYIRAHSTKEVGTSMRVYLPQHAAELFEAGDNAEVEAPSTMGPRTVLLVEDNQVLRKLTGRVLEELGCRVISAANGRHALDLLDKIDEKFDLVVTDVVMPEIGGVQLVEQLSKTDRISHALFVSGHASDIVGDATVLDSKRRGFLSKPFSQEQLIHAINALMDSGN